MKKIFFSMITFFAFAIFGNAQNTYPSSGAVGIGTTSPNSTSLLDVNSTTKGVLLPRMTIAQRVAISSPANGLLVYQTDGSAGLWFYNATAWQQVSPYWANSTLSNLKPITAVNSSLLPGTTASIDLGSSSKTWRNGFYSGVLTAGSVIAGSASTSIGVSGMGSSYGVSGSSSTNYGVYGNGKTNGVYGTSSTGTGVYGTGPINGVYGVSSGTGTGVLATGGALGVYGSGDSDGVVGYSPGRGRGVFGQGGKYGVYGSGDSIGIWGSGVQGVSATGTLYGVHGESSSGYGIYGNSLNGTGVQGQSENGTAIEGQSNGYGTGVSGQGAHGPGIYGFAGRSVGVEGASGVDYGGSFSGGGTGGGITAVPGPYGSYAGFLQGDVFTTGAYVSSDKTLKRNIHVFDNAISTINKLKPRNYEFKEDGKYALLHLPKGNHYGLIAQDLQEVLPDLVKDASLVVGNNSENDIIKMTSDGKPDPQLKLKLLRQRQQPKEIMKVMAINYTELIPIMIKGMQELNTLNDTKDKQIADLQNQINELRSLMSTSQKIAPVASSGYLKQNFPNPASSNTIIQYTLPENTHTAKIIVTDDKGSALKVYNASGGEGQITLMSGTLPAGTYNYTLYVNDKAVDSKQMVILK